MERGGLFRASAAASLAVLVLLALPAALADVTQAPVQGNAYAEYEADAGALLAQARPGDASFQVDFTYAHATLYEILIPATSTLGVRSGLGEPPQPIVISAQRAEAGRLQIDARDEPSLLVFTDPRGLSVDSLPLSLPQNPAKFVVDAVSPVAGALMPGESSLDPHDLQAGSTLHYAIDGVSVEKPIHARAEGDLIAVIGHAPVRLLDGRNVYVKDVMPGPEGERFLLVQAEGAKVAVAATGLTAILHNPAAGLGAGGQIVATVEGREVAASPHAGVRSGSDGLDLDAAPALSGSLAGPRSSGAPRGTDAAGQGATFIPLDARTAAAGAAVGTALALAAVGVAALGASGKYSFFALLAPLYARLQSNDVLSNRTREGIYRFVVEHPGVNVSEVVTAFSLGWGATVYHLRVLERSHLVSASKQGRQVCYFQNGGRYNGQMAGISALRNDNAALVARTVLQHPGIQQREICRLTTLAQPTVSWHLQRLEEAGVVGSEGAPRKRYTAQAMLVDLAARGLLQGAQAAVPAAAAKTATPTNATTPTTVTTA